MTYDDDTAIVLWPEYFDSGRSRAQGRKAPLELCVKNPQLDIIAKGAMIQDLEYKIFEEKAYPGNWAAKRGCVRVERGKLSKTELIYEIGRILVKNQGR
jgi:signal recognition particle subunit SRP19